jgi:spore coat polysaccharide biosynthesis protein SpsF
MPRMILAILQARMSSTRLPGKVMADVLGAPMILRQIERLECCTRLDRLTVATSVEADDDVLAAALRDWGLDVHRGPLNDVLARFEGATAELRDEDLVVRLTADCPLTDPHVIDDTVAMLEETGMDYGANTPDPRCFPKGLDVEVMRAGALRQAAREAKDPYDREHVTPYLYRHPERFTCAFLHQEADEAEVRWTVDRPDDLEFVRQVYGALYRHDAAFTSEDVRNFVRSRPDLAMFGGDRRI